MSNRCWSTWTWIVVHVGVDRAPRADRGFGAVRKRETDLNQAVDSAARIRLVLHELDDQDGSLFHPVLDELAGVGRPAGEVVIEGPGGDAEAVAHLGQLQSAVAEVGQHVEAGLEVSLARNDARHGTEP